MRRPFNRRTPITIPAAILLTLTVTARNGLCAENAHGLDGSPTPEDVMMLTAYILMALVFSFLCSVAEAVLLSITPSYIEGLKERYPQRAQLLQKLKNDNVDQSLAAILTLNTIAHTVGAIGAGAKATVVFGSAWFGLFSAVMTLMILFFSEIVPKTIGAVYWSTLVGPTALFVRTLIILLYPVVWISEKLTTFISHGAEVNVFSRDELIAMASLGVESGQIRHKESRIITNILRLDSLKTSDIMTPRTVISALPETMKIGDALQAVSNTPFSRIPLYNKNVDDITGFILKDDVLIRSTKDCGDENTRAVTEISPTESIPPPPSSTSPQIGEDTLGSEPLKSTDTLGALKREILAVPDSIALTSLFEKSLKDRHHIAIIINEHGGTEGLVTLEDLIETIIGMEIVDETDNVEDMRLLARKRWVKRAKIMGLKDEMLIQKNADP